MTSQLQPVEPRPAQPQAAVDRVQVIILAAGLGSRLGRSLPKPLTVLADGQTILQRQLSCLEQVFGAAADVCLVVGHKAGLLMLAARDSKFVQNPRYHSTNTSKSLLQGLRASDPGGVLWLNGDVVFDPALLELVADAVRADRTVICVDTSTVADEEVKYTVDGDGFIQELSKTVVGGLGEAVGVNYVSSADKQTLIEHLELCDDNDYFERAIETAIAAGRLQALPLDISAYTAVEVDFEEDLVRANLMIQPG